MKFNRALFILTILVLNSLSLAEKNSVARRSHRVNKSHTHKSVSESKNKAINVADVIQTIAEIFKNPKEFLMTFIIGALSAYDENFLILFEKFNLIKGAINACTDEILGVSDDTNAKKFSGSAFEAKMDSTDKEKKKEYCEACQKTTEEWKTKFSANKNGNGVFGFLVSEAYTKISTKKKTCSYVLEALNETDTGSFKVDAYLKNQLLGEFKTRENWIRECEYIMDLDCDDYNPQYAGIKGLGEKVYKYWKKIGAGFNCIKSDRTKAAVSAIIGGSNTNLIYGNALVTGLATIFGGVAGVVANVMTLGIWGSLKGGYYLVKTGILIKDIAQNPEPYMKSYLVGKITGNLIIMLKSFTLGKKRRFRKFRK